MSKSPNKINDEDRKFIEEIKKNLKFPEYSIKNDGMGKSLENLVKSVNGNTTNSVVNVMNERMKDKNFSERIMKMVNESVTREKEFIAKNKEAIKNNPEQLYKKYYSHNENKVNDLIKNYGPKDMYKNILEKDRQKIINDIKNNREINNFFRNYIDVFRNYQQVLNKKVEIKTKSPIKQNMLNMLNVSRSVSNSPLRKI
jgi:hypothetical protein